MKNTTAERWLNRMFPLMVRLASDHNVKPFDVTKDSFEFKDGNEIVIISIKTKPA